VGLIARQLEARGISTICMSSARSITERVNPPRSVYLDFPLGHTAGRPDDVAEQRHIMIDTLRALETIQVPGTLVPLRYRWSEDETWKDTAMRPRKSEGGKKTAQDDRIERHATPQYQFAADQDEADPTCPTCVFPEA
jgi:chloramphenicol 3-O-phosphotransferase